MMKIPPWSHSSLNAFETCPRRYYLTRVSKEVADPPGEAAIWGDKVHKAIEARVKFKHELPQGMAHWEPVVASLDNAKSNVLTEYQIALTRNLEPCEWQAENCWARAIIDVAIDGKKQATLLDWKTGKMKPENDQLRLSSALWFAIRPNVQVIKTAFVWLPHNKLTKDTITRDEMPRIWGSYIERSDRLAKSFETNNWPARSSGLCKNYCPATRAMCPHSGRI